LHLVGRKTQAYFHQQTSTSYSLGSVTPSPAQRQALLEERTQQVADLVGHKQL
jgi:hypothetical protein